MYRRVILSLLPRRPALTPSPEPTCTPPLHAHAALRAGVQVSCRAFGSTGVILCEEKDRTTSPPSEKVENDERTPKTTEPTEPEQRTEHRTEAKSGKKALLELLGGMKLEVTTKRKKMKATREATVQRASLSEDLLAAASTLPDSQAKSKLLQQLRNHESISTQNKNANTPNIQKIITDMPVGQRPRIRQNRYLVNQIRYDGDDQKGNIGELAEIHKAMLYSRRLNIFPTDEQETDPDLGPSLWDADLASQIVNMLNNQPRNGFEEMIQWTREGRMWRYPIDNEADMDEEASVPFHEHVFLERHLEDGFPQQGPVRHFMELVVTGLSKNHQLSVQLKLEHIAWFREYFQQKQDVLKEAEG